MSEEEENNLPIIILPSNSPNPLLYHLEQQTEELANLLSKNIEKAREKGRNLDSLNDKTYDLLINAELFRTTVIPDEPVVVIEVEEVQEPKQNTQKKITNVKDQLDNLVDLANENLHKATERGIDLEKMLFDSNRLAEGAKAFNATNRRVKRFYFLKDKKMLAILIIVIFLLFIIFLVYLNSII